MKAEYLRGIILMLGAVFAASVSQLMLKVSANHPYSSKVREYLNPMVIGGYALMLGTTFMTVFALRWIPLSLTSAMESAGQVFVPLLSCIVLKERINRRRCFSMMLIVLGILIFLM